MRGRYPFAVEKAPGLCAETGARVRLHLQRHRAEVASVDERDQIYAAVALRFSDLNAVCKQQRR